MPRSLPLFSFKAVIDFLIQVVTHLEQAGFEVPDSVGPRGFHVKHCMAADVPSGSKIQHVT